MNQRILRAKGEQLEEVPFWLYGVAGTVANWLPVMKRNRANLEGYYRPMWLKLIKPQ